MKRKTTRSANWDTWWRELAPGTNVTETHDESDPRSYRVSFDKIRSKLGFRASIDLVDGVREMVDAVRDGRIGNWRDQVYSNQLHMKHTGPEAAEIPHWRTE